MPLNILFKPVDNGAVGHLRMRMPAKYLTSQFGCGTAMTELMSDHEINRADIIVLQYACSEGTIRFVDILRAQGKKVVYEIDDDVWHVPHYNQHSIKSTVKAEGTRYDDKLARTIATIMSHCDAVTVPTAPLADVVREHTFGVPVHVLPNCMEFEPWMQEPHDNGSVTRIGWAGGFEHGADLDLIVPALIEIKARYKDRVEIVFLCGTGFPRELEGIAEHHPYVSYGEYLRTLKSLRLDIGLLPLIDNAFNRSKSCLKFLDYSALGIASIASPVYPYDVVNSGWNGLVAKKNRHTAWITCMELLINEAETRKAYAKDASEFVRERYNITNQIYRWYNAYSDLIDG